MKQIDNPIVNTTVILTKFKDWRSLMGFGKAETEVVPLRLRSATPTTCQTATLGDRVIDPPDVTVCRTAGQMVAGAEDGRQKGAVAGQSSKKLSSKETSHRLSNRLAASWLVQAT